MNWGHILLCVFAVAIGVLWIILCYKKVIPDPVAKWTMAIAGVFITVGIYPLVRWLAGLGKKSKPVPIPEYEPEGPTEEEVEKLDEKVEETDKKLEEIDAEDEKITEAITPDPEKPKPNVGFDPALGGDFAERLRKIKEAKAARTANPNIRIVDPRKPDPK